MHRRNTLDAEGDNMDEYIVVWGVENKNTNPDTCVSIGNEEHINRTAERVSKFPEVTSITVAKIEKQYTRTNGWK
jgi:hypothetical protein